MRDLLVQIFVYGLIPFIPFRPFLGLLLFSWLAYMRPQNLAWGLSASRLSFYVGIATLIGVGLAVLKNEERPVVIRLQTVLLIGLAAWFAVTGLTAVHPLIAKPWVVLFSKVILISVLTTGMVNTRERFRLLMLVISFSLGLLGAKYALYGLTHGGARFSTGPGGFMSDNNLFALALNMALPLLLCVAATDRVPWVRIAARSLVPFVVLAIVFTFSRGGFIALAVTGALLIAGLEKRVQIFLAVGVALIGLVLVTPADFRASYIDRLVTTADFEQDGSAMGRIDAWKTALRMTRDHPLFGVGPDNFVALYPRYGEGAPRVSHNVFLQHLSESGIPALLIFVALLAVTTWRLQTLYRRAEAQWIRTTARMFQISLAAYVTAGMFLDMAYFDLFYQLVALSVPLQVLSAEQGETATAEAPTTGPGELPWWKQPREAHSRLT